MKKFFVFDLDKPSEVVSRVVTRFFVLVFALTLLTAAVVITAVNVGWMQTQTWPVAVAFAPLLLLILAGAVLLLAPAFVGLFVAYRLPAPKPFAERNLLFSSVSWVVRVFWGATLLVAGGIIGGFIAQNLDAIAELARRAPAPAPDDPALSEEAAEVLTSFVDIVFFWVGLAVVLALLAAAIAVTTLSVRVLNAGAVARLRALTPRTEPPTLPSARRLAWRQHFSHWGYGAYLLGFLFVFGTTVAFSVLWPLVLARQGINDLIQSFVG